MIYKLITDTVPDDFNLRVTELLDNGWSFQSQTYVTVYNNFFREEKNLVTMFSVAMTKDCEHAEACGCKER